VRPRKRGYSRFVSLMKFVLPGLAVTVMGAMMLWPQIKARTDQFVVGFATLDPRETDPRTLVNPRFLGLDDKEQPYTLIARSAEEHSDDPNLVDLDNPQGDILLNEGRWVALNGDTGLYSKQDRTLDLWGNVTLYRDDGFEFKSETAHLNLDDSSGHGDDPVKGQWPDGTIQSEGFELIDGGAVINFTGHANLLLYSNDGSIAP